MQRLSHETMWSVREARRRKKNNMAREQSDFEELKSGVKGEMGLTREVLAGS